MNCDSLEETAERYIYDVTRRLPRHQKEDISRELHGLIDDMLETQAGGSPTQKDLEKVLIKLGEPKKIANQYRDQKRYLIGPSYFEQYTALLKIVLPCVFFGITVASFLDIALVAGTDYSLTLTHYFASVLSALFQGFTWVTLIFACIEYNSEKRPDKTAEPDQWNPADLPKIPSGQAVISRSDPIAGIVFTILVIILFNFAPQLMGVYSTANGFSSVPIFDLQVLKTMLPILNLCFAVGIAKEVFRLGFGKYSIRLAVIVLTADLLTVCLTVAVFSNGAIWNPDLLQSLSSNQIALPDGFDFYALWNNIGRLFIAIVVFANVLDSAVCFFKGFKASSAE